MRKLFRMLALTPLAFAVSAFANDYQVDLNKTQLVHLPDAAAAIVIGNPDIADVSVHSSNTLFVLGRGYGATNMIVLNSAGHTIMNANIRVGAGGEASNVRVFNGSFHGRHTYSCTPYCEAAPMLGDEVQFRSVYTPESQPIINSVASGASAPAPTPSFDGPPPAAVQPN